MQQSIFISLAASLALVSCGASNAARTKDFGGSPSDVSKSAYVVYQTSVDRVVHKGECPPFTKLLNRHCSGLKDIAKVSMTEYEADLRQSILAKRPGGAPTTPSNPKLVKALEEKIARISTALEWGGLTPEEKAAYESQLIDLKQKLAVAKESDLTMDEQVRFDFITQRLFDEVDVTIDEGHLNYDLAIAPFFE